MSFQGDVAGIGLGELLQGLARGGRDGVLTLDGERQSAGLGLKAGQLFILPSPDEDDHEWRERCKRAWADHPDAALETSRRTAIARSARLENLYRMLAAPNLHFRFDPGPLPVPPVQAAAASAAKNRLSLDEVAPRTKEGPWGPGLTVEYVLLEHARIADESASGPASTLDEHDIPRALDPSRHAPETRQFLEQCDGSSTLLEIADRLGITLSQCRATVGEFIAGGHVRIAGPRELLAAAQRELELGRFGRAATRIAGWLHGSPPGPPPMADADLLAVEWQHGRMDRVLPALEASDARALLRKLDHVHTNTKASCARWSSLAESHKGDSVSALHEIALRLTTSDTHETRTFHDLLRIARDFHEEGRDGRTRTLLRLAASHLPSRPQTRVELGKRMLDSGLADEGVRWLLDTARELNDDGQGERALVPIRIVLRNIPDQPEANELLVETRMLVVQRRRRRWSVMTALSVGLVLSLVALVRYHGHREIEGKLSEINAHMDRPDVALALLNDYFGNAAPERVEELRTELVVLEREAERRLLDAWMRKFKKAEEECTFGDPAIGLKLTLALPPAPDIEGATMPERQDLFGMVSKRLTHRSEELDLPPTATLEELRQEQRLVILLEDLLEQLDPETDNPEESSFHFRLAQLHETILERREERAQDREAMLTREREREQDILLAAARAHDRAGDLDRALATYERLVEMDPSLSDLPEFRRELDGVRAHWSAVLRALELCEEGDHEAAEAALEGVCERPVEHLMPWRVESRPSGAHVSLPDGRVRITPFVATSGFGESVELIFEHPGCEPRTVVLTKPTDLAVHLHQTPERVWENEHRIEAAPVPVGDDHVAADRYGRIVRLDRRSRLVWEIQLDTLGGIARTPVFLPERPGHLLVVSEDGRAWLVDASDGSVNGPREIGSPPRRGPLQTRAGVTASFADGRVGLWTRGLEPTFYEMDGMLRMPEEGENAQSASSTMVVLRNDVGRDPVLASPWNGWRVEVHEDEFLVLASDGRGLAARRSGDWSFVAWESPKAMLPHGRLWISDEDGLRSYVPSDARLVVYSR